MAGAATDAMERVGVNAWNWVDGVERNYNDPIPSEALNTPQHMFTWRAVALYGFSVSLAVTQ